MLIFWTVWGMKLNKKCNLHQLKYKYPSSPLDSYIKKIFKKKSGFFRTFIFVKRAFSDYLTITRKLIKLSSRLPFYA